MQWTLPRNQSLRTSSNLVPLGCVEKALFQPIRDGDKPSVVLPQTKNLAWAHLLPDRHQSCTLQCVVLAQTKNLACALPAVQATMRRSFVQRLPCSQPRPADALTRMLPPAQACLCSGEPSECETLPRRAAHLAIRIC